MGWAERLPSGKYRALYRDRAGKRRSAGTFPHKRAAERAADVAEDSARKLGWRDPAAALVTWGEWCSGWTLTRSVSGGTASRDASPIARHIRPRWHDIALAAITKQDVKAWTADLRRQGLANASILRYLSIFSASLTAAVDAGILPTNPAIGLHLPPAARGAIRFLTDAEYVAVAAELEPRDLGIANFLVGTGMRWGEMAGLHAHRIDSARGMIAVVETWDERGDTIKPYPKGKKVRDVALLDWVHETLPVTPQLASCGVEHREGRCRSGLVFRNAAGGPENVANWTKRIWAPALERSGIGHARPHDLRHTYASWALQAGVPLAEVGRALGHMSSATTDIYAHLAATPRALFASALPSPLVGQEWGSRSPQDARISPIRPYAN